MKYSLVAAGTFSLIGYANSAPVASGSSGAEARGLVPPYPGMPNPLPVPILPRCSTDGDCNEGHYCITETGMCSVQTREEVMAQEETGGNEKRYPPPEILQDIHEGHQPVASKEKRIIPPTYPYTPGYVPGILPIKKGECTSDADCEGDHYCVTETETCSIETREAVMAGEQAQEPAASEKRSSLQDRRSTAVKDKRSEAWIPYTMGWWPSSNYDPAASEKRSSLQDRRSTAVKDKRRVLWPINLNFKQGECTSDADCEGDHYCITETESCSDKTRQEAMADSAQY